MGTARRAYPKSLASKTAFYLRKIDQIDRLLEGPAKTLIHEERRHTVAGSFRELIDERQDPAKIGPPNLDTRALCVATLQKLYRLRRRFPWLKTPGLKDLPRAIASWIESLHTSEYSTAFEKLRHPVFGPLNPLTASYIFRLLLEAGESNAHRGLGFLAFFAMIWPLYREFPDRFKPGARLEPWPPTAYLTAKCLLPLVKVRTVTQRRADLFYTIEEHLTGLHAGIKATDSRSRWQFSLHLDGLWADLLRLSRITNIRDNLVRAATVVKKLSEDLTAKANHSFDEVYQTVLGTVRTAIQAIAESSNIGLDEIKAVLTANKTLLTFFEQGFEALSKNPPADPPENVLKIVLAEEYLHDKLYWYDLYNAARSAEGFCRQLLEALCTATAACAKVTNTSDHGTVVAARQQLRSANETVAACLGTERAFRDAARWCRTIVDREIAHASAKNLTEFDPSELVNAIAVVARWELVTTRLQLSDAVQKGLRGASEDGSWRLGRPFFSPDNALALWPGTSETIWALMSAIQVDPDVRVADKALLRYLNWLERSQVKLEEEAEQLVGWPSERLQVGRSIHLPTTAFSINALLEIRDLIEYRLWQLCQQRFTAVPVDKPLSETDPVDLNLPHRDRIHSVLSRMASDTQESSLVSVRKRPLF
jgi:hypothetical protein